MSQAAKYLYPFNESPTFVKYRTAFDVLIFPWESYLEFQKYDRKIHNVTQ